MEHLQGKKKHIFCNIENETHIICQQARQTRPKTFFVKTKKMKLVVETS